MTDCRERPLVEYMQMVEDPRSPRVKKHDLAETLTCIVVAFVTGHIGLRRTHAWCCRHLNWLRKGLRLKNGIASVSTMSRMLSQVDVELFLYAFMEWVGERLNTRGLHIAIDGKALRGAASKVRGERAPVILNAIEVTTGLVLAQLPIQNKDCEITKIPELLKLLDIHDSIITTDAIGTQTKIMQQIVGQGAHFLMTVKKNQSEAYNEINDLFNDMEEDDNRKPDNHQRYHHYDLLGKLDTYKSTEKNRDRNEMRVYQACCAPEHISKTKKEWPFIRTVGRCKQLRILRLYDSEGRDITPNKRDFLASGTRRQPSPLTGDHEASGYQVVGMISDSVLSAKEMGDIKRKHWRIENTLHHALDDTFREDRSPAKGSANNLALIRKFAYNIIRFVSILEGIALPNTEIMDLLDGDKNLLGKYIFEGIPALN